jgi:hypothetical protein
MADPTAEELAAQEREEALARGDYEEGKPGDPLFDAEQAKKSKADDDDGDDGDIKKDGKTTHVPYTRFKEVNDGAEEAREEAKRLKAENEELRRGKAAPAKSDDDDAGKEAWEKETDPRKLRELASDALLEGDAKLATKMHNRADDLIEDRSVKRAAAQVKQEARDEELAAAARQVVVRYPFLDETNKKEFQGKAVVEEVLALRDTYLRQGKSASEKIVWSRDVWSAARDQMFIKNFIGTDQNSMIQRVTELTKTEKGEQVLMHLVADLVEDGVIGDNEREGNEEAMQNYSQEINIDLLTHSVKNKGKLSDQKTVINFREHGPDKPGLLAGQPHRPARVPDDGGHQLRLQEQRRTARPRRSRTSRSPPTSSPDSKRALMWNGTSLAPTNTGSITTGYVPKYKMIVDLIAYAKDHYIKPLMSGGKEYYVLFVAPGTLAALKKDADYQRAVVAVATKRHRLPVVHRRTVTIDGAVLHEHRLVYNTKGAASARSGAPAAPSTAPARCCAARRRWAWPTWAHPSGSRRNSSTVQQGINVDKMLGLLKPQFHSIYDGAVEDFGIMSVDHYLRRLGHWQPLQGFGDHRRGGAATAHRHGPDPDHGGATPGRRHLDRRGHRRHRRCGHARNRVLRPRSRAVRARPRRVNQSRPVWGQHVFRQHGTFGAGFGRSRFFLPIAGEFKHGNASKAG